MNWDKIILSLTDCGKLQINFMPVALHLLEDFGVLCMFFSHDKRERDLSRGILLSLSLKYLLLELYFWCPFTFFGKYFCFIGSMFSPLGFKMVVMRYHSANRQLKLVNG